MDVLYLMQRMPRGVFPPRLEWLHAAPESGEANSDPWVWKEQSEGAHVWSVSSNAEQNELDALARAHDGWPVVRGGRVPIRKEDVPQVTRPADGERVMRLPRRRLTPQQVFERLEKQHLA